MRVQSSRCSLPSKFIYTPYIMSGLNRLLVPDLGEQANLRPVYQRGQVDMSAPCDGCHSRCRPEDGGKRQHVCWGKEGGMQSRSEER